MALLLHFFANAKMHLMRFNREAITQALAAIPGNFEMRLYVDGDFANMQDVDFGCLNLAIHKSRLTGQSFALLLAYNLVNTWPELHAQHFKRDHNAEALNGQICQSFANHTRRVYRGQNWREACAWIKGNERFNSRSVQ
jgi:hypothetical protein